MKLSLICTLFVLVAAKHKDEADSMKRLAIGIPKEVTMSSNGGGSGKGKKGSSSTDTHSCAYNSPTVGCLEVLDGQVKSGSRLVLGDCSTPSYGFTGQGKSMEHLVSLADDSLCMDVGDIVANNVKLTLMPCDKNKPSQYFFWSGSRLQPVEDSSLCVTYRGFTADVGEDLIILKPCATVVKQEGKGAPKDWCFA